MQLIFSMKCLTEQGNNVHLRSEIKAWTHRGKTIEVKGHKSCFQVQNLVQLYNAMVQEKDFNDSWILRPLSTQKYCVPCSPTDYGRPERKQPSLHGRKFNPNPKFLGKVQIILEQRYVVFLSPSKICENLNFSREIQIFENFSW